MTVFSRKFTAAILSAASFAILSALALPAAPRAAEVAAIGAGSDVGDVLRARGNIASVYENLPRTLAAGSDVKFLDTIVTGTDTRAEIKLIDDSVLSLGDDTALKIDEMVYDPGQPGKGVLTLTRGVFRMVSGKINKTEGGTLTLKTPVATIGVRGTDFWGLQEENKLTMALIDNGIVEITGLDGQTVVLNTPLQAVVIERGQPTPATPFNLTPEQLGEAAKTVTY